MNVAVRTFPDGPYPVDLTGTELPRVCIVTGECVGPFRNGGLGTSMTGLAELLAAHGFPVAVLYTGELTGDPAPWIERYAQAGLELLILDRMPGSDVCGPLAARGWTAAYRVYEVLRDRRFDVIHFNDTVGEALYCTTAKRLGLAFGDSLLCLALHSPTQWILELNGTPQNWIGYTCFSQGERDAVSATDLLWGPSRYLLQWIQDHEFRLPGQVYNQQYVVPTTRLFEGGTGKLALPSPVSRDTAPVPPREIVFFGRLEERKGIRVFCNALTEVAADIKAAGVSVVFMGKPSTINGKPSLAYLEEKAKQWSFPWKLIDNYDQQQALGYLTKGDCVGVMPSPFDNSPCTVYEAIQNQVPFIAARRGGIPELIHDDDKAATLFDYTTSDLAARLRDVIARGIHPARPPITIDANRGRWIGMHLAWQRYRDAAPAVVGSAEPSKVSVVIDHSGNDEALAATMASVRAVLADRVVRTAVLLRGAASVGSELFDLVVEDTGEASTSTFENWLHAGAETAVVCLRSGASLVASAATTLDKALAQPTWDGLLAVAEMKDGNRSSIMPSIASPAFLLLEDKYDTGAAVFRRSAFERLVPPGGDALVAEQQWCGLVDAFALGRASFWPLAEPLTRLTPQTAVVWRGEQARRTLRYTRMMAHDTHFVMAIGARSYQEIYTQHLALPSPPLLAAPTEFIKSGKAKRALGLLRRNPAQVLKIGLGKLVGRPRAALRRVPSPVKMIRTAGVFVSDLPTAIAWVQHRRYYRSVPYGPVLPIAMAASGQWRLARRRQAALVKQTLAERVRQRAVEAAAGSMAPLPKV